MKIFLLILALLPLANCANQTSVDKIRNDTAHSTPTIENANNVNANNWQPIQYEADKIDKVKRAELDAQNEKFRQVPDEFKGVDFKNFKYPYARLKNGEYVEEDKKHIGGTTYSFDDAFLLI